MIFSFLLFVTFAVKLRLVRYLAQDTGFRILPLYIVGCKFLIDEVLVLHFVGMVCHRYL